MRSNRSDALCKNACGIDFLSAFYVNVVFAFARCRCRSVGIHAHNAAGNVGRAAYVKGSVDVNSASLIVN